MSSHKDGLLSILTWNVYFGTVFSPLFTITEPSEIPFRVTEVFRQFLATNFPLRARAIARQIICEKPDIVGLSEVAIFKLIPPNSHEVIYDFIKILLHELEEQGVSYRLAALHCDNTTELPSSSGNTISFTDREAILVREKSKVRIINSQEATFDARVTLNADGLSVTVISGWCSIDAVVEGHKFRVVNTHLTPISPPVQVAQGNELLAGPGNTELPLIFIGDFNSNADGTGTDTYENLIAAGFYDTWLAAGIGDGFTCCQEPDLLNAQSHLLSRIDLILIKPRGKWQVLQDVLVGESQEDRTYSRLWASDHAGVASKLLFKTCKNEYKNSESIED
jgi:endonuclease/exonuclease/phosphatase family metal-dependent hydrolase